MNYNLHFFYIFAIFLNRISRKCIPITENITQIPKNFEYIEIRCTDRNVVKYRDAFPVVHPIVPLTLKGTSSKTHQKLNVMILVLESTSKQNFQRQMPRTRTYLSSTLSAVPLQLFNKIGYNTHPNMVALLTGQPIKEFGNNCLTSQPNKSTPFLNDCPFIWKNFSERGYVTSFMEDCSLWPIFNHYWTDLFIASPTDYYYLPFAIRMDGLYPAEKRLQCHGPRLTFENMLKFGKMISEMAATTNTPYFQFMFSSRQTYKDMNGLKLLDTHLLRMLKQMKASNALNSTALFILGDHGYRFYANSYAQTLSGETEDKMPVGYVILPKWFKRKFPTASINLFKNAKKRTTAFDIHATLNDLMDLTRFATEDESDHYSKNGRGISLFRNIPEDRTCLEAGIPLEWCLTCYPNVPLLVFDNDQPTPMIMEATKMFINSINEQTKKHRDSCLPLKLKGIENAWKWDPRDVYSELCGKSLQFRTQSNAIVKISCDGFTTKIDVVKVELITSPNNGTFEGEAIRLEHGEWVMMQNVMRVDAYYNQSWCVPNKEIKPYCFCDPKLRESYIY